MYGYNNHMENNSSYVYTHFPTSQTLPMVSLPTPLAIPSVNNIEYDSLLSPLKSEVVCNSSSCSSYGSPSSVTSYGTYDPSNLIQRSISSHSLLRNNNIEGFCPMVSSPTGFLDSETSSVRKVLSTGDLQVMHILQHNQRSESSLSSESNSIIEGMNKASRYSPEEKKERIERYRSKRNHRNFNKKIKYECRKTLADSRPRIRGRFARNDEIIERNPQNEYWTQSRLEEGEEDDENWIGFLDAFSANLIP